MTAPRAWKVVGTQPYAGRARAETMIVIVPAARDAADAIAQAQAHLTAWAETWEAAPITAPFTFSRHATPKPPPHLSPNGR